MLGNQHLILKMDNKQRERLKYWPCFSVTNSHLENQITDEVKFFIEAFQGINKGRMIESYYLATPYEIIDVDQESAKKKVANRPELIW